MEASGLNMDHPAIRYAVVIGTAALLQYVVFSQFRIAGVSADLFLVVAIAAGIVAGSERGAVVGFVCGACLDLLVVTPFGLGAISGCWIAGGGHDSLRQMVDRGNRLHLQ